MTLPSVTQVLAPFCDFSRVNPVVLERACARGTRVHAACAAIASGLWAPTLHPSEQSYVDSFERWLALVDEVVLVEHELIHPVYQYVGHLDLCVRLRGDDAVRVVDLKTPVTEQATWAAQIAAYAELVRVNKNINPKRNGTLRLSPEGKMPKWHEYKDSARDLQAFLSALAAWTYFKN